VKKTIYIPAVIIVSLLVLGSTGCHRKAAESARPKTLEEGMTQLQAVLATASPQAQSNFYNGVSYGIRYGKYSQASLSLQQIASDPSLTDQQKQVVNGFNELLKQAIEDQKSGHKPAQ
jgi:hypothetical protein